jgi:hypothetical protein
MKNPTLALTIMGALALANGPAFGQIFQKGPYYVTPSWDQKIPAAQRFVVLTDWSNEAVLDNETGLVWQSTPFTGDGDWSYAAAECRGADIGNRLGWRLPSVEELASLVAPKQSHSPALPVGHPFQNILPGAYWTASTVEGEPTVAWTVYFGNPGAGVNFSPKDTALGHGHFLWCVRGGSSVSNPP